jgi:hypothetical protein
MERTFTVPEMILWTGTRIALGVGIGMLVSRGLSNDARKSTGIALTALGAFTTIPLGIALFGKKGTLHEMRSAA